MQELILEALGVRNTCSSAAFLSKIAHFSTWQIRFHCQTICRAGSKLCCSSCRTTGRKQESMTFPPLRYNRQLPFWWSKTKIEFIFMQLGRDVWGGIKCDPTAISVICLLRRTFSRFFTLTFLTVTNLHCICHRLISDSITLSSTFSPPSSILWIFLRVKHRHNLLVVVLCTAAHH